LKSVNWLSYGKIRASWGQSGVQFDKAYLAHGLMEIGAIYDGEQLNQLTDFKKDSSENVQPIATDGNVAQR